tara:strand:+ start:8482 stop:9783 length:1302 start_codon:yes stop_codon:yes gene_type:complete
MIKNIIVSILLFTSVFVVGQRNSSSPYSYFGIGDEFNITTVEQSAMGGIGVAFSHYKYLNFTNPAAYANLRYSTYSLGLLNNDLTVKTADTEQSSTTTTLSYVALAFPIGDTAGFSFGMQPISSMGYSLANSTLDNDGNTTEITLFQGSGGVNRFYGSFGIKVYKGLSLGFEGDFSFGNLENSITNQIADVSLATKYRETTELRGASVKLGAQYEKKLKNDLILNAGATVKFGNDLSVVGESLTYSLTLSGASEFVRDTLVDQSGNKVVDIDGDFNLPLKTVLGVGIGELDKWYAGIEYENQDAISTTGLLGNTTGAYRYGKANRIALGGFYLPKINSISSYWNRVTYRAGLRYENTGLLINNLGNNSNFTEINDFGISFGLGLPLKQLSTLNMGFEFGKRGTIENNLIQENYFNFRLSLSLSERWFIKRKID